MSFPVTISGKEGEQYKTYTTKRWPFGTKMKFQDGREFAFVKAGASDLVIGDIIQSPANVANHVNTTAVASAAGSTTPTVTLGATLATLDQYADGFAVVSVTPDAGHAYKIKSHPAADSAATLQLTLESADGIIAAWTTTSRVDLIANKYNGVIQVPVTTMTGPPVGVAVSAIGAAAYGWIQCAGTAAVLTVGTVVIGSTVKVPATTAGGVIAANSTYLVSDVPVGVVRRVAASAAWSTVDLAIPQ